MKPDGGPQRQRELPGDRPGCSAGGWRSRGHTGSPSGDLQQAYDAWSKLPELGSPTVRTEGGGGGGDAGVVSPVAGHLVKHEAGVVDLFGPDGGQPGWDSEQWTQLWTQEAQGGLPRREQQVQVRRVRHKRGTRVVTFYFFFSRMAECKE